MKPMIVRGCPPSIANDAWWLSADGRGSATHRETPKTAFAAPALAVMAIVVLADVLLWNVSPGASLALMVLASAGVVQATLGRKVPARAVAFAWGGVFMAAIALLVAVTWLSKLLMWVALLHFASRLVAGSSLALAVRTSVTLPAWAVKRSVADAKDMKTQLARGDVRSSLSQGVRDWAVALGLGVVFLGLFALANPMLSNALDGLSGIGFAPDTLLRLVFWLFVAALAWPAMRLSELSTPSAQALTGFQLPERILNPRSLLRALLVFNALFAMQTVMDLAYLWGGVRLPNGMSYAEYAHRGAYPLVIAALLAGGFALLAQPLLGQSKLLRPLLLAWVGQTLVLTISSLLRLDLYVGAYGLTYLRFASFLWMGLLAAGLLLMLWQILTRLPFTWLALRSLGALLLVLWCTAMVNVDGLIARVNLTPTADRTAPLDRAYLCRLGEGVSLAVARADLESSICKLEPDVPTDWREWGYRNWRLRRSLAAIREGEAV